MRSRGRSRAIIWLNAAGNTTIAWFNRVTTNHPYIWGALKWLAIGAAGATALYFSGGLAAIPFLTPLVAQIGAATIAVVTPVLAVAKAFLWNVVAKPLGNLLARGFRSIWPSRSAQASPPPPPVTDGSSRKREATAGRPQSTPSVTVSLSSIPEGKKLDPVSPKPRQPLTSVTVGVSGSSAQPLQPPSSSGSTEVKEGKYEPGKGGTALVLVGDEIDLSYMYDTLTVYPKTDAEIPNLDKCLAKCKELATVLVMGFFPMRVEMPKTEIIRQRKTSTCMMEVTHVNGAERERYVHHDEDDHDFYHQDDIDWERDHSHIKFRRAITQAQFTQMVDIFRTENLITQVQRDSYIAAFAKRNTDAEAAVDALCTPEAKSADADGRKLADGRAIIQYVGKCQNNDVLLHLHEYLLSPKFDYLRAISKADQHPKSPLKEWQGTNRDGRVVPTSGSWAKLEKAISLQMIENWRQRARNFTPALGTERSAQMARLHGFFGIKRSQDPNRPHAVRTYKTQEAFSKADTARLAVKRRKIFG